MPPERGAPSGRDEYLFFTRPAGRVEGEGRLGAGLLLGLKVGYRDPEQDQDQEKSLNHCERRRESL